MSKTKFRGRVESNTREVMTNQVVTCIYHKPPPRLIIKEEPYLCITAVSLYNIWRVSEVVTPGSSKEWV